MTVQELIDLLKTKQKNAVVVDLDGFEFQSVEEADDGEEVQLLSW